MEIFSAPLTASNVSSCLLMMDRFTHLYNQGRQRERKKEEKDEKEWEEMEQRAGSNTSCIIFSFLTFYIFRQCRLFFI